MFVPNYKTSEATEYCLEEIERVKFRVEKVLIMPKHEQWLQREAFVRTAFSSTMVENPSITEEEMEAAAKPSPAASVPKDRADVANYALALNFVDYLSDDNEYTPDQAAVRQIHFLLMKAIQDTKFSPGKYRTEPNWIEDQGVKVYEPPIHVEVPILMMEFSDWLQATKELHTVLKAGIAHAHLVAIHPFVDGNGRTARLLATLILQKYGYGFRKLLSLDAYYQRNRDEYLGALKKSLGQRWVAAGQYDLTPWLEFFSRTVLIRAQILEQRLTEWRMMVDKIHQELEPQGILNSRQVDGLIYARKSGQLTRKDYAEINSISLITASRDLADMTEKGLLARKGKGRNLLYESLLKPEKGKPTDAGKAS